MKVAKRPIYRMRVIRPSFLYLLFHQLSILEMPAGTGRVFSGLFFNEVISASVYNKQPSLLLIIINFSFISPTNT
jgi:hypothetical protein